VIPPEVEAKILRLHFAEKWKVGTIAEQLGVHHDAVERVIAAQGAPAACVVRPSRLDPYLGFVQETFGKYPKLPASRLFEMCKARGYVGSPDHFRHRVAQYRPKPRGEAYLRLHTLPGEQVQVDWAHFGKVEIGRTTRWLMAFVMVLAWSRAIFLRFYYGQSGENFLRGHVAAFEHWEGVARQSLYDNLKSAVLERIGDAIRFNPLLLELAGHYRFEPRPVAPGRGNEKPRVERAIRYVRSNFWPLRRWRDLEDLNRQALEWCTTTALERPWHEDPRRKVRDALAEERTRLLPLPATPFPCDERREVAVGKTPYVRFDLNDYSVPHEHVRQTLVVVASLDVVRVLRGEAEVARHARSFGKGEQIEDPRHVASLVEEKRKARKQRSMDRLAHAAPSSRALLERMAERGANLGNATQKLTALLDTYGAARLEAALVEALGRDAAHPHGVQQILEQARELEGKPPLTPILPSNPKLQGLHVRPHSLAGYDALAAGPSDSEDEQEGGANGPAGVAVAV
jgi:transposase